MTLQENRMARVEGRLDQILLRLEDVSMYVVVICSVWKLTRKCKDRGLQIANVKLLRPARDLLLAQCHPHDQSVLCSV